MTFYLVKHSEDDYKLHQSDGSVVGDWNTKPSESMMADELRNGWRIVTDGWDYRDLTIDAETVPWDSYEESNDTFTVRTLKISLSDSTINNDGSDSVTLSVDVQSDSSETVDGSIGIGGDTLTGYTFSTSSTTTEEITTTAASGTTLDIQATSPDISDSSIKQLEVQ